MDKLGVENYVAIQKEEHQWSDRKKKIDRIVIPIIVIHIELLGYATTRISKTDIIKIINI